MLGKKQTENCYEPIWNQTGGQGERGDRGNGGRGGGIQITKIKRVLRKQ
jgi:hypothetical protein